MFCGKEYRDPVAKENKIRGTVKRVYSLMIREIIVIAIINQLSIFYWESFAARLVIINEW